MASQKTLSAAVLVGIGLLIIFFAVSSSDQSEKVETYRAPLPPPPEHDDPPPPRPKAKQAVAPAPQEEQHEVKPAAAPAEKAPERAPEEKPSLASQSEKPPETAAPAPPNFDDVKDPVERAKKELEAAKLAAEQRKQAAEAAEYKTKLAAKALADAKVEEWRKKQKPGQNPPLPESGAMSEGIPFFPLQLKHQDGDLVQPTAKAARRAAYQHHCGKIKSLRHYMVTIPSDICELLPFMESYIDECDIVAEAGSRLGTSTIAILNRNPKKFASLEIMVHGELRAVHRSQNECHKKPEAIADAKKNLQAYTGSQELSDDQAKIENFIVEGDDIKMGLPWPSVEFLFIDTLHNANQLWKELEVFPQNVTKWIAFHDSHSYKNHDENNGIRRNDVPAHVLNYKGLRVVIDEFLKKHKDEWVEEMNFVHNFGWFIIRRRSWVPQVVAFNPNRRLAIAANAEKHDAGTAEKVGRFISARATHGHVTSQCNDAYRAIDGRNPHPVLCGQGYSYLFGETFVRQLVAGFREADGVHIFDKATFPMGYSIAMGNMAFILNPSDEASDIDYAAEFIAFFGAWVGVKRQGRKAVALCLNEAAGCRKDKGVMAVMKDQFGSVSNDLHYETKLPPSHGEFTCIYAGALSSFSSTETFGSPYRIMVWGTAMADATKFSPSGYELKTALNEGMGLAVWEKIGSQNAHYVPL